MRNAARRTRAPAVKKVLARIAVRPPTRPSSGACTISSLLGTSARLTRTVPLPRQYSTVINWGNPTEFASAAHVRVINPPSAVARAINKLLTLRALQAAGVRIPEFSTTPPADRRTTWLARGTLTGSGGVGITVVRKEDRVPDAPLYTKYVKKNDEARIHVAFGQAILLQYKKRERDNEQTADQKLIRNHENGWVFCPRPLADISDDAKQSAVAAVAALGLHFGAVDLVIGRDDGLAYILEVNTAPGIESPTLKEAYKEAFTRALT